MGFEEELSLVHGYNTEYSGYVPGIPSLNIPPLYLNDGPQGFRDDTRPGTTTSFPSGLTVAASFDPDLAFIYGQAMGIEFFNKGCNVQLGPGLNTHRI